MNDLRLKVRQYHQHAAQGGMIIGQVTLETILCHSPLMTDETDTTVPILTLPTFFFNKVQQCNDSAYIQLCMTLPSDHS